MKPTNKHPYRPDFAPQLTVDEFMDAYADNREGYRHLQIFLTKTGSVNFGDYYLMLGRNSFGIVQLIDIDYQDEKVLLDLLDTKANKVFKLPIDIHRRGFQGMFWKLADIREMIREFDKTETDCHSDENKHSDKDIEDLLELDESQT